MITFHDVRKSYGSHQALSGVSFTADRHDVLGCIGPNGAGKTTTAKILTGLSTGHTGTVEVTGTVGYLPQEAGLQEWRTVRHTLRTFALLSGLSRSEADSAVDAVIDRLGLREHAERRIAHLSGGMQQRVRFAQAIVHDPQIVILDEPLTGLDAASRAEIKRTIRSLADESRTILLYSHVLADVEDLATRILILDRGEVRAFGTTADLRAEYGVGQLVQVRGTGLDSVIDAIERLPAVERAEKLAAAGNGPELRVHLVAGTDQQAAIRGVMGAIVDSEAVVHSVQLMQPTLEELYLSLTGGDRE